MNSRREKIPLVCLHYNTLCAALRSALPFRTLLRQGTETGGKEKKVINI